MDGGLATVYHPDRGRIFSGVAIIADCANLGGNPKLSGNNGKWYAVMTDSTPFVVMARNKVTALINTCRRIRS